MGRRRVWYAHVTFRALHLLSTYRPSNKYFQAPCMCWEMYTQKKNVAVSSFESDMVWLQSKYKFSSLSIPSETYELFIS